MSFEGISKSVHVESAPTRQRSEEIEDLEWLKGRVAAINKELGSHVAAFRELYGSSYRELNLTENPSSAEIAYVKERVARIENSLGWRSYQDTFNGLKRGQEARSLYQKQLNSTADEIASGGVDAHTKRFWLGQIEEAKTGGCGEGGWS